MLDDLQQLHEFFRFLVPQADKVNFGISFFTCARFERMQLFKRSPQEVEQKDRHRFEQGECLQDK